MLRIPSWTSQLDGKLAQADATALAATKFRIVPVEDGHLSSDRSKKQYGLELKVTKF